VEQKLMVRCVRFKIQDELRLVLDSLHSRSSEVVKDMLKDRDLVSSKHWKEVPCVVAKGLTSKYQNNPKCKEVKHLSILIHGDKGKQVKLVDGGIRVPALFKKVVIPIKFPWPIAGFVRSVEFFKRDSQWFMSACVNTLCEPPIEVTGVVGVDRNSVGNVAVMADIQTGKVLKLGINPAGTKRCFRGRRGNLQREAKNALLVKVKRRQSRRMTYENHRASKTVVDYAATHRRAIVLEDLKGVHSKGSKIRRYSEKNQWAFAQLAMFIEYKAALRGVPVLYVDPAYTSQRCSRCGHIQKPNGKRYSCASCGHKEHRDANAAFNIGRLGAEVVRVSGGGSLSVLPSGSIGGPYAGKEPTRCVG
jgi:putative transposase